MHMLARHGPEPVGQAPCGPVRNRTPSTRELETCRQPSARTRGALDENRTRFVTA